MCEYSETQNDELHHFIYSELWVTPDYIILNYGLYQIILLGYTRLYYSELWVTPDYIILKVFTLLLPESTCWTLDSLLAKKFTSKPWRV